MLDQRSLWNDAQQASRLDSLAGLRPGRELPVLGRKSFGLRAASKVDSLLIAHHRKRPLEAVVCVRKQSWAEQNRQRRPRSVQRLTRPQAVGLFINLNRRDVMVESDDFAGQARFAHLHLFEHAERPGNPRPDDWAADPRQRAGRS